MVNKSRVKESRKPMVVKRIELRLGLEVTKRLVSTNVRVLGSRLGKCFDWRTSSGYQWGTDLKEVRN